MKKDLIDELEKAFDIPEPKRKQAFIAEYEELIKKNERRPMFPVFMKYASTAVFAALIIAVWSKFPLSPDYSNEFNNNEISEAAVTTEIEETGVISETTPVSDETEIPEATKRTKTSKATSSGDETETHTKPSADETHTEAAVTNEENEAAPVKTTAPEKTTSSKKSTTVRTSAVRTSSKKTSPTNTAAAVTTGKTTKTTAAAKTTAATKRTTAPVTKKTTMAAAKPTVGTTTKRSTIDAEIGVVTTVRQENGATQAPGVDPNDSSGEWYVPDERFYVSGNVVELVDSPELYPPDDQDHSSGGISPSAPVNSFNYVLNVSDGIVEAYVEDIIYTLYDNRICTQVNLSVLKEYRGVGTEYITLYCDGGYIPASRYEEITGIDIAHEGDVTYCKSNIITERLSKGNRYLFFIIPSYGDYPDGTYTLTTANEVSVYEKWGQTYNDVYYSGISFKEKDLLDLI